MSGVIETIRVECEDDGFHLVLTGDIEVGYHDAPERISFKLPQDAALELLDQVKTISEWAAEGEAVRQDHERYRRTGIKPDYAPPDEEEL